MPFSSSGVYTPPAGVDTTAPGQVIRSSLWNTGFSDIATALTQVGELLWGTSQTITSGNCTVAVTDTVIIFNKGAAEPSQVILPAISTRVLSGLRIPLEIYDYAGNAGNITLTPSGSEKIMGVSSWIVTSGGTLGTGGAIRILPLEGIGWGVL